MPDFDLSLWDDEFMKPEIRKDRHILSVQTTNGIEVIPCDTLGLPDPPSKDSDEEACYDFSMAVYPYLVGGVEDPDSMFEPQEGFVVRLQAPGYTDPHPIRLNEEGQKCWTHVQGDKYLITGVDVNGKRFRSVYDNWAFARGINLYRGSRWLLRGGKRFLITRVFN